MQLNRQARPYRAVQYLPPILVELRKKFPDLNIRILDNSKMETAERVFSGEAEFGIMIVSVDRWDLEITPLLKEPFVVICLKSHPFAGQKSSAGRRCKSSPWCA